MKDFRRMRHKKKALSPGVLSIPHIPASSLETTNFYNIDMRISKNVHIP